jgi:copper homeostasis protein
MSSCLVEIVTCSVSDVLAAEKAGAHRVELCSAIELEGLTPSLGTVKLALSESKLPVMAMLRPRKGGFVYSEDDLRTMEQDAEAFVAAGVHGLVLGILRSDNTVDEVACRRFTDFPVELVHHRAFDVTPDPFAAMEAIIRLGFRRILTSGQKETAIEGAELIRKLREVAAGRIEVLPACGIRPSNVAALIEATGVDQVHLGPFITVDDEGGLFSGGYQILDAEEVRGVVMNASSQS